MYYTLKKAQNRGFNTLKQLRERFEIILLTQTWLSFECYWSWIVVQVQSYIKYFANWRAFQQI